MAVTRTARVISVLAATVVTAVSAAGPVAAQPESSQETSSQEAPETSSTPEAPPADGGNGFATPPPSADSHPVPEDTGVPDLDYAQATNCVQSQNQTVTLESKPWGQDVLQYTELGRFATGVGETVAVIDTGVIEHDFLRGRLRNGPDYVDGQPEGSFNDCDGHGTEVAGIIAANPNDEDIGFVGIAPNAEILSIRQSSGNYEFKDPNNTSAPPVRAGNLRTLAMSIIRAVEMGATVINMSVDSCRPVSSGPINQGELDVYAAAKWAVEERDVVLVASAGNLEEGTCTEQNSSDPQNPTLVVTPPWFSEYVISVAAMDKDGSVADFSIQGPWVSVSAPGTEIISLNPADRTSLANEAIDDGERIPLQGTSFAAPYVAGLAALVRERHPKLTAKQVMHRIKATASHPAANGGRDNLVGHGMINPVAALTQRIPAEHGEDPDQAIDMPFEMPPPYERNWAPVQVAMIGAGGGVGLLLLTLFVVHTVRRNRREPEGPPKHRV
jgi:membrane-anchored mycosin MYCP